ncbi:retrovirus-related pol polyprotein from transposon TNT 1-94 [Tanacetum coccineum]|uniref:Retrovirus-related pol polyprotein from transposon TNT 1-94 n=1 Tax=Tanacetum coccineum TaxID=301880 RepID=A0ABQ5CUW6_9ASTR
MESESSNTFRSLDTKNPSTYPNSSLPNHQCVRYVHTIFPSPPLVRKSTFGFKPGTKNNQNSPQVLPSFEVYTPLVTYPKEVEETIGIPMEVEPLDHMKLEDLGLNTNTHDFFISSKGFASVDELEPQLLPNFSPLDVNLGDKRGTDPPINPYSPGSSRMKEYPSHVYKLKKALYGLKQAPRAWYDMLSSFLISQHFSKGAVDLTLFTRKAGNDLLLTHLWLKTNKLDEDLQGTPVDAILYHGMIGSLMYLTSSRPNLIYAVCLCARYHAKPTEKHLNEVKQIFRYLKGTINMGLWYSKDIDMSLTTYSDAYHTGCQDTRRGTSGSAQF